MITDPQHLLEAHLPFYKKRKFWLLALGIQAVVNLVILKDFLTHAESLQDFIFSLTGILGAVVPGLFMDVFFQGITASITTTILFIILAGFLLYNTCKKPIVNVSNPLTLFIMSLVSLVIMILFSSTI